MPYPTNAQSRCPPCRAAVKSTWKNPYKVFRKVTDMKLALQAAYDVWQHYHYHDKCPLLNEGNNDGYTTARGPYNSWYLLSIQCWRRLMTSKSVAIVCIQILRIPEIILVLGLCATDCDYINVESSWVSSLSKVHQVIYQRLVDEC